MTVRSELLRVLQQEDINFLLTNRIPRRLVTQFIGWFSRIEQPLVRDLSIGTWRLFSDLDLREAKKASFRSMHDCFVRELKDGARPIDRRADVLVSPCDAIVGACGAIAGTRLYQAKGFPYALGDLLPERDLVEAHRNGRYVTLRLTASCITASMRRTIAASNASSTFPAILGTSIRSRSGGSSGCSARTNAPS